jgi:GT2 family glycosyltransferase/glycosyltransferase involved in cell wall biosynthesis
VKATETLLRPDDSADNGSLNALLLESVLGALDCDTSDSNEAVGVAFIGAQRALQDNHLRNALTALDYAWRTLPDETAILAPVYGRLLTLEGRDYGAALRVLERTTSSDPDVVAAQALALLAQLRGEDARRQIARALSDFCVLPGGLLARATSALLHSDAERLPGWIGIGPEFELVGELSGPAHSRSLDVRLGDGTEFTQALIAPERGGRRPFQFKLAQLAPGSTLTVSCRGTPLLGSGLRIPLDLGLDGRTSGDGRSINGWARLGWRPTQPVVLRLKSETGFEQSIVASKQPRAGMRWPYRFEIRNVKNLGSRIDISALLPDGRWLPLPDTPFLLEPAAQLEKQSSARLTTWAPPPAPKRKARPRRAPTVDIIIPVYRGKADILACIQSVLTTAPSTRIVVVDDASEDLELAEALDNLETSGDITLLRNATNLGFVASVNRGLARAPTHDAVLLNSDTVVFGDWLGRLRAAAYGAPNVGTVTPFSNAGSIASYPSIDEQSMTVEDAAALHQLAASSHNHVSVDIPVGVGFCLYLRRDCLRDAGELDLSVFGHGYGEEVDFCLRARLGGWTHRLAADVFVYHAGGRSFGSRRLALLERSQRLLNLRHPGFDGFIADFKAKNPLTALRRELDQRRLTALGSTFVLLVTMALPGGVRRFVTERCREIRAQGLHPLVLRPYEAADMTRCELWTDAMDVPNLRYQVPQDLEQLGMLLRSLNINSVEINHFLHLDARVIDLVQSLDRPYDFFVHDYALICPRITLIDGSGRYCGEPAVTACEACVKRNGGHLEEDISVADLRRRSSDWLNGARRVIAPSSDAASRLKKYFPMSIEVHPQVAPAIPSVPSIASSSNSKTVRVAIIGAIGEHKGYNVLLNCARDAKVRGLSLEFSVIGYTEDDKPLLDTGKVFITGRYSEGEASHLLRRETPDIAFFPSVWPETWCYAVDEAVEMGLKVVAFDLGAVADRVRSTGLGMVLPLATQAQHINDKLLEYVAGIRASHGKNNVITQGILDSSHMSKNLSERDSSINDALSASVQVLPLPSGLYLFSVKAAGASADRSTGALRLPAMHVGLGPGVKSEQVEFLAGPSTQGGWLFAQEDVLVTKVSGAGATLVLTSVRAPGGEILSIKVERLEGRDEAPSALTQPSLEIPLPLAATNGHDTKEDAVAALPLTIGAHIRARGDMNFSSVPWAGRIAPGLWIESFSIKPLETLESQDVEYKGLTGSGFETPWLSDGKMCGTKGMAVPLVGFAVRLKSSPKAASHNCEYSGYFKSGLTVGPLKNGAPCRSTVANDPLEGIQVRIVKRADTAIFADGNQRKDTKENGRPSSKGPSFGRYRDNNGHIAAPASSESKAPAKPAPTGRKNNGTSSARPSARRS